MRFWDFMIHSMFKPLNFLSQQAAMKLVKLVFLSLNEWSDPFIYKDEWVF